MNFLIFNPKNKTIKITAAMVCACFLWQDVVWATGSNDFLRQRQIYVEGEKTPDENVNASSAGRAATDGDFFVGQRVKCITEPGLGLGNIDKINEETVSVPGGRKNTLIGMLLVTALTLLNPLAGVFAKGPILTPDKSHKSAPEMMVPAPSLEKPPSLSQPQATEEIWQERLRAALKKEGVAEETIKEISEKSQKEEPQEVKSAKEWVKKELYLITLEDKKIKVILAAGDLPTNIININLDDIRLIVINEKSISKKYKSGEDLKGRNLRFLLTYAAVHFGLKLPALREENVALKFCLKALEKLDYPEEMDKHMYVYFGNIHSGLDRLLKLLKDEDFEALKKDLGIGDEKDIKLAGIRLDLGAEKVKIEFSTNQKNYLATIDLKTGRISIEVVKSRIPPDKRPFGSLLLAEIPFYEKQDAYLAASDAVSADARVGINSAEANMSGAQLRNEAAMTVQEALNSATSDKGAYAIIFGDYTYEEIPPTEKRKLYVAVYAPSLEKESIEKKMEFANMMAVELEAMRYKLGEPIRSPDPLLGKVSFANEEELLTYVHSKITDFGIHRGEQFCFIKITTGAITYIGPELNESHNEEWYYTPMEDIYRKFQEEMATSLQQDTFNIKEKVDKAIARSQKKWPWQKKRRAIPDSAKAAFYKLAVYHHIASGYILKYGDGIMPVTSLDVDGYDIEYLRKAGLIDLVKPKGEEKRIRFAEPIKINLNFLDTHAFTFTDVVLKIIQAALALLRRNGSQPRLTKEVYINIVNQLALFNITNLLKNIFEAETKNSNGYIKCVKCPPESPLAENQAILGTNLRNVVVVYDGKPADLKLQEFKQSMNRALFLAGASIRTEKREGKEIYNENDCPKWISVSEIMELLNKYKSGTLEKEKVGILSEFTMHTIYSDPSFDIYLPQIAKIKAELEKVVKTESKRMFVRGNPEDRNWLEVRKKMTLDWEGQPKLLLQPILDTETRRAVYDIQQAQSKIYQMKQEGMVITEEDNTVYMKQEALDSLQKLEYIEETGQEHLYRYLWQPDSEYMPNLTRIMVKENQPADTEPVDTTEVSVAHAIGKFHFSRGEAGDVTIGLPLQDMLNDVGRARNGILGQNQDYMAVTPEGEKFCFVNKADAQNASHSVILSQHPTFSIDFLLPSLPQGSHRLKVVTELDGLFIDGTSAWAKLYKITNSLRPSETRPNKSEQEALYKECFDLAKECYEELVSESNKIIKQRHGAPLEEIDRINEENWKFSWIGVQIIVPFLRRLENQKQGIAIAEFINTIKPRLSGFAEECPHWRYTNKWIAGYLEKLSNNADEPLTIDELRKMQEEVSFAEQWDIYTFQKDFSNNAEFNALNSASELKVLGTYLDMCETSYKDSGTFFDPDNVAVRHLFLRMITNELYAKKAALIYKDRVSESIKSQKNRKPIKDKVSDEPLEGIGIALIHNDGTAEFIPGMFGQADRIAADEDTYFEWYSEELRRRIEMSKNGINGICFVTRSFTGYPSLEAVNAYVETAHYLTLILKQDKQISFAGILNLKPSETTNNGLTGQYYEFPDIFFRPDEFLETATEINNILNENRGHIEELRQAVLKKLHAAAKISMPLTISGETSGFSINVPDILTGLAFAGELAGLFNIGAEEKKIFNNMLIKLGAACDNALLEEEYARERGEDWEVARTRRSVEIAYLVNHLISGISVLSEFMAKGRILDPYFTPRPVTLEDINQAPKPEPVKSAKSEKKNNNGENDVKDSFKDKVEWLCEQPACMDDPRAQIEEYVKLHPDDSKSKLLKGYIQWRRDRKTESQRAAKDVEKSHKKMIEQIQYAASHALPQPRAESPASDFKKFMHFPAASQLNNPPAMQALPLPPAKEEIIARIATCATTEEVTKAVNRAIAYGRPLESSIPEIKAAAQNRIDDISTERNKIRKRLKKADDERTSADRELSVIIQQITHAWDNDRLKNLERRATQHLELASDAVRQEYENAARVAQIRLEETARARQADARQQNLDELFGGQEPEPAKELEPIVSPKQTEQAVTAEQNDDLWLRPTITAGTTVPKKETTGKRETAVHEPKQDLQSVDIPFGVDDLIKDYPILEEVRAVKGGQKILEMLARAGVAKAKLDEVLKGKKAKDLNSREGLTFLENTARDLFIDHVVRDFNVDKQLNGPVRNFAAAAWRAEWDYLEAASFLNAATQNGSQLSGEQIMEWSSQLDKNRYTPQKMLAVVNKDAAIKEAVEEAEAKMTGHLETAAEALGVNETEIKRNRRLQPKHQALETMGIEDYNYNL